MLKYLANREIYEEVICGLVPRARERLVCCLLAEATLRENGNISRRSGSGASAVFFFRFLFSFGIQWLQ